MAMYKHAQYVTKSEDAAFDKDNHPGTATPFSGIYRCMGCGKEDVSTHSHPLPPQNHHQHTVAQGPIRWRLIVYADHQPKSNGFVDLRQPRARALGVFDSGSSLTNHSHGRADHRYNVW